MKFPHFLSAALLLVLGAARPLAQTSPALSAQIIPVEGYSITIGYSYHMISPGYWHAQESYGTIHFYIRRSGANLPAGSVDFDITTLSGGVTNLAHADFAESSGTLTFAEDEPLRILPIRLIDDDLIESAGEVFTITLRNPIGGTPLGTPASARLRVEDNDYAVHAGYSYTVPASVPESVGAITITATRSGAKIGRTTVEYLAVSTAYDSAKAGLDYVPVTGTLVFEDDDTVQSFVLPIIDDQENEGWEKLTVAFAAPLIPPVQIGSFYNAITIEDDDQRGFAFAKTEFAVAEDSGQLPVTVRRVGDLSQAASVGYSVAPGLSVGNNYSATPAAAGEDFQAISGRLDFAPGETEKIISIPIIDDPLGEPAESLRVTLSSATAGTVVVPPAAAEFYIEDNEVGFHFAQNSLAVPESAGRAVITVRRAGSDLSPASVRYFSTANIPSPYASPELDFATVSGRLQFGAGETEKTFTIQILNDGLSEDPEVFHLKLASPLGATTLDERNRLEVTITDDDPGFSIVGLASSPDGPFRVAEREGEVFVTLAYQGDIVLDRWVKLRVAALDPSESGHSATPGLDFESTNLTVRFRGGQSTVTVPIRLHADALAEEEEHFNLTLFNAANGVRVPVQPTRITLFNARLNLVPVDLSFRPSFPPDGNNGSDFRQSLILPDGKIMMLTDRLRLTGNFGARLLRLLPDGSIDPQFTPADLPNEAMFRPLPDGGVLVTSGYGSERFSQFHLLARLRPDGSLDPSFNLSPAVTLGRITALATNAAGQIAVAGSECSVTNCLYSLYWLEPDGSLAANPGYELPYPAVELFPQPDGSLVGRFIRRAPSEDGIGFLARLKPDGALDSTFAIVPETEHLRDAAPLPDGRWLALVRTGEVPFHSDPNELRRLLPNGATDPSFPPFKTPPGSFISAFATGGQSAWLLRSAHSGYSQLYHLDYTTPEPAFRLSGEVDFVRENSPTGYSWVPPGMAVLPSGQLLLKGAYLVQGHLFPLLARLDPLDHSLLVMVAPESARLRENGGQQPIWLLRSGDLSARLTLTLTFADGTARAGHDYLASPQEITFLPGSASASISLTPLDNQLLDEDRSISLRFKTAEGLELPPAQVTIVNDDLGIIPGSVWAAPGVPGYIRARFTGHLTPFLSRDYPGNHLQCSSDLRSWSLNCVRLNPWDSEALFAPMDRGTPTAFWRIRRD